MYPESESSAHLTKAQTASGSSEEGPLAKALARFVRGFINLRTMPLPLRIVTLAGFALLGSVAVTLALSTLRQPHVAMTYQLNGQATQTTLLAFLMVVIVGGTGFAYALAGAMSLPWLPRLAIVALVTWALFDVARQGFVPALSSGSLELALEWVVVPVAQFVLLGALWLWALGVSFARWRRERQGVAERAERAEQAGQRTPARQQVTVPVVLALAFICVYFGLDLIPWVLGHATSAAAGLDEDRSLIGVWSNPVTLFALIAPLFVYWFCTDSTEWSTTLAAGVARLTGRIPWLMATLTAVVALAICGNAVRLAGSQLIAPVIAVMGVVVLATLVVLVGPPPAQWPAAVPPSGLVVGVLTLFAVFDLPILLVSGFMAPTGILSADLTPAVTGAISTVDILIAIFLALALAAWGRLRSRGDFAVTGLFVMLVASTFFIYNIDQAQSALGISWVPQPTHLLGGIESLLALATLGLLAGLLLRRRPLTEVTAALTGPLIALVGLQVIDWYLSYALSHLDASPGSITLVAAFFLAAQVWDVARSGEPITNGGSPRAPRASRVLVYFGYTLVAAALFLYASSLRVTATGAAVPQYLLGDDNATVILVLSLLCVPLALVTGFIRFQQWRVPPAMMAAVPAPVPRHSGRARLLFAGIVSSGMVLTAVTSLLITVHVAQAPRSPSTSVYTTTTPGPNCDAQGATWAILPDVVTQCQRDGLHVTAPASQVTFVGFIPPGVGRQRISR